MNQEHTKYLYDNFPKLYADKDLPMTQSLMCFGFEHGDGWFEIIKELSEKITATGVGVTACQVKEKFGTLRFYIDFEGGTTSENVQKIYDLIEEAENKTEITCEECGKPGTLREGGWFHTYCDYCEEHYNEIREARHKLPQ